MGFLINLVVAFFGGWLGSYAFPHWNWWVLLGPSLMALLLSLRYVEERPHPAWSRGLVGFTWGLAFFGGQLTWLTVPASSPVPWVALTILEALFIAGFGVLWGAGDSRLQRSKGLFWIFTLLWAPVAWIAVEQIRAIVPFEGFPWSKLAFALVDSPFAAWAPWCGSIAVGGVAMFVTICAVEIFHPSRGRWRHPFKAFFSMFLALTLRPLMVVLAVVAVLFPHLIPAGVPTATGQSLKVAAVQGNTPGRTPQTAYGEPYDVLNHHVAESLRLRETLGPEERVDLVVWAENAADMDPRIDAKAAAQINRVTDAFAAPLIAGTLGFTNKEIKNTIIYWNNNEAIATYSKKHLVPFGEYLPWRKYLETLAPDFAAMIPEDMSPGNTKAQLKIFAGDKDITVATPICYEIADDALVREAARGANFIALPTSNTFFGDSDEADQQLAIARFRALEHGLDTVQVSTMDSTARIDSHGNILGKVIPNYTAGSFVTAVPLRSGATPATLYGEMLTRAILVIFAGATLLLLVMKVIESRKR
ncbi:MAG: apolipoprotein N-acyltransferase [Mobiluncus porci]|uniref:Apolipoprotein N-acyltransferase n=1 Tax=Mobiluncus porci TaxID=2652278 RepID=A0A7K0K097_9ACTO|nr:apolipoprotein N-acyltransferase [Mobiluncus porci]MDD7541419.1 apolipoprotein N-acyltransferase [Mobiluncus porci]MDY5748404.1 apolipoprotein N-acyltransferase [Mobiluncus porci]MST48839.1 apolipoprotein N-acyltransferase [Mobiluncus porci]